jgi:hypothetical protein
MYAKDRRVDEMLANAREIGKEEAARLYQEDNYKKYGVVAGFKTSPDRFESYIKRRAEEDERAKHGLRCRRRR